METTKNLIGSGAVNASKLYDDKKVLGLWFVFQDLSVRTEGVFRYVSVTPSPYLPSPPLI